MKPSIGRIVHYRIGGTNEEPVLAPAQIVAVWSDDCVNLVVTFDGTNHDAVGRPHICPDHAPTAEEQARCSGWRTSVTQGEGVGYWRWPART